MYEKVIERLLWNTAQHEYSTCNDVTEVLAFPVNVPVPFGDGTRVSAKALTLGRQRHTRYRVKRTSACGGCLGDHRR